MPYRVSAAPSKKIDAAPSARTLAWVSVAMACFAANSLLARMALRAGEIDGGSFSSIRVAAGAAALSLILRFGREASSASSERGSWSAAIALFSYALAFSYAYLSLSAGTGALVLFAAVQITMFGSGMARGERPRSQEWLGLALAFVGLVYLVSPGLTAPSTVGVALMAVAGVGWGVYSLAAKGVRSAIAATTGNFVRTAPLAALTLVIVWTTGRAHASWLGIGLAAVCGGVTSGVGYTVWYHAAKEIRTGVAAIVQLSVPVLTAVAGVVLLHENLSWRLALASCAILGGVGLALSGKSGD
jgi:drug/metabolite transporter (DMT)-like permease